MYIQYCFYPLSYKVTVKLPGKNSSDTHTIVSQLGVGESGGVFHIQACKYHLTQSASHTLVIPFWVTLCLSDRNPHQASSRPVFLTFFFPPCRCCRAHVSRYSSTTWAGQQAAVLSPVIAQYGAAASAVHCVCGAQCQSRSPGGGATTLTGQSGAAQHENTVVSHFKALIVKCKG